MRAAAFVFLVSALAGAFSGCGNPLENSRNRAYNVLLVTIDTLRADHVGAYGCEGARTPNLDRLASEGALFKKAFTPTPLTLPAHTSIMTGTYPTFHGVRNNGMFHAQPSLTTLAEVLKEHGYATCAVVGAYVLNSSFGLDQGFDRYDDEINAGEEDDSCFAIPERKAEEVTSRSLEFLRNQTPQAPFFLWVHYFDPHDSYDPPQRFAKLCPGSPYDGEIAYVDEQLGVLLKMLSMKRLLENTLIVLAGDHGEGLMDHGEENHGVLVYDSTLHVPLILNQPGVIPASVAFDTPVSLMDIMPTVLDLLNLDGTAGAPSMQGSSLVPLLAGEKDKVHDLLYFETLLPFFDYGWSALRGVRGDRLKYIDAPKPELYDTLEDAGESKNLAAERERTVEKLRAAMMEIAESTAQKAGESALNEVNSEVRARLEALGYASGASHDRLGDNPFSGPNPMEKIWTQAAITEARTLFEQGRYDQALQKLEDLLEKEPKNSHAILNLAMMHKKMGHLKEAERYYRMNLELQPKDEKILTSLSNTLDEQGRPDEAIEVLKKVISYFPDRAATALYHIALINLERGAQEEAEEALRQALEIRPDFADALNNLGTLYARRCEYEKAVEAFQKALQANPKMGDVHFNCGMCCYLMKNYKEALFHMDQAMRLGQRVDPTLLKDLQERAK